MDNRLSSIKDADWKTHEEDLKKALLEMQKEIKQAMEKEIKEMYELQQDASREELEVNEENAGIQKKLKTIAEYQGQLEQIKQIAQEYGVEIEDEQEIDSNDEEPLMEGQQERQEPEGKMNPNEVSEPNSTKPNEEKEEPIQEIEDVPDEPPKDAKFSLRAWLKYSGLDILANINRNDTYTEEEFMRLIDNRQDGGIRAPKMIKEPGKAARFLNNREAWDAIVTTQQEMEEALYNGNIPVEAYAESYVLVKRRDGERTEVTNLDQNRFLGKNEVKLQMIPPEVLREYEVRKADYEAMKKESELADGIEVNEENSALVASVLHGDIVANKHEVDAVENRVNHDAYEYNNAEAKDELDAYKKTIEDNYGVDIEEEVGEIPPHGYTGN